MTVQTLDRQRFFDSTLAYYVNQLDRFDQTLHEPLYDVTWGRDIKLLPGMSITFESTSFTRSSYGYVGSQTSTGKPWLAQNSNTLPNVSVNGERVVTPVRALGQQLSYTSIELEKSRVLGTPLDTQQMNGLNIGYQMNTDEMVYIGDNDATVNVSAEGLVNSSQVTASNVVNGASGFPEWNTKTPAEQLADVNTLLESVWTASGYAACPDKLILPPAQFSLIVSEFLNTGTSVSTMKYLKQNSLCLSINGRELDIVSSKWLTGAGVGATDRMLAYTNKLEYVRFPLVPIRRETTYYSGINFNAPYVWAYGEVEFVYPETLQYADGI